MVGQKIVGIKVIKEGKENLKSTILKLKSEGSSQPFQELLLGAKAQYDREHKSNYMTELSYKKLKLFSWSMVLVLLTIFSLVIFKNNKQIGIALAVTTVLVQVVGVTMRVMISGRAPITNMYETVMFSGLGSLILALIIFLQNRKVFFHHNNYFFT